MQTDTPTTRTPRAHRGRWYAAVLVGAIAASTLLSSSPAGAIPTPGSISGTVTNPAGGHFTSGHFPTVALWDVGSPTSSPTVTTADSAGHYTFADVQPGTYHVGMASASPDGQLVGGYLEWYSNSVTRYRATPVVVGAGQDITGIDNQLEKTDVCPPISPAPPGPFADVDSGQFFCHAIEWVAKAGIAGGFADNTYQPTNSVSRQAMASFLFKFIGDPTYKAPATPSFTDVPKAHPFYRAIEWLASTHIANGYDNGTFLPSAPINRGAIAAFLYRAAGQPAYSPLPTGFPDVAVDHPFRTAIEWLWKSSITSGYEDGTFRPGAPATRQAMAIYLQQWDVNSFLQGYGPE